MQAFETDPGEEVRDEIRAQKIDVDSLASEAQKYLGEPDVDDISLARMFIERGYSENFSYWLIREAEVRRAPR